MLKKIIYAIVILGLIGGAIGYYEWHKPHEKVEDASAVVVSAVDLCSAYAKDEKAADSIYRNKALEISGEVSEVKMNQDGNSAVTLKSNDELVSVQCTMRDKGVKVEAGKTVVIKGFFADRDMFGPILTDCVLKQ
ncbi:MAG: hypothetical protein JST82_01745 [Bacteroidetes bacterium]|nr:hypothetical protein [Bacteroidota bacterium]